MRNERRTSGSARGGEKPIARKAARRSSPTQPFYASVEQRDNPRLRGKPVIVAWQGNRSVVCAASYEARSFGVHSAMPAKRAECLCPDAIFVPPDFTRYRAVSRSVREIFKRHTDLIEPLSLDEAYLDVTENKTGLATATLVARTIRQQIRQELNLTASERNKCDENRTHLESDDNLRNGRNVCVISPDEVFGMHSVCGWLLVGRLTFNAG
jgi:DNA polymerase-4